MAFTWRDNWASYNDLEKKALEIPHAFSETVFFLILFVNLFVHFVCKLSNDPDGKISFIINAF